MCLGVMKHFHWHAQSPTSKISHPENHPRRKCFDMKISFGAVRADLPRNEEPARRVRPVTRVSGAQRFNLQVNFNI
jgi:hypothetical protein